MTIQQKIKDLINATAIQEVEVIQELWSGYGSIIRYNVNGKNYPSIIVKHIQLSHQKAHPRGWNSNLSHLRKIKSYEVETYWYHHFSSKCDDKMKVPHCLAYDEHEGDILIIMEDLDNSGYPKRLHQVGWNAIEACLKWLANFHAKFLNTDPKGLWEVGTYWHLETRPDELETMDDLPLKKVASRIDEKLNNAKFKTIVHGDAKLANFCFSENENSVAAVDFQYVGGGIGMKDLIYFVGSCMMEEECEKNEEEILDFYFRHLKDALHIYHPNIDINEIEKEWRTLFIYAWTDFHRFLKGWSPGHWKINSYSEKLAQEVIKELS